MTREEERIKQIEQFASQCYEDGERYSAFISGAIWADNNHTQDVVKLDDVWYDVSEEPKDGKRICVHFGEDNCGIYTRSGKGKNEWRNWCKVVHALRWAYISDLLPKGGKK